MWRRRATVALPSFHEIKRARSAHAAFLLAAALRFRAASSGTLRDKFVNRFAAVVEQTDSPCAAMLILTLMTRGSREVDCGSVVTGLLLALKTRAIGRI